MEQKTTRDPSGRVTIYETDDRDTPFPIVAGQVISARGVAAFSELIRVPMERARRGHLLISANVVTNAAFANQYVCIEINIVGYIGAAATTLLYTAVDSNLNLATFGWDEPLSLAAIGIEARQNVDGLASGSATGIDFLTFTLAGTYWR